MTTDVADTMEICILLDRSGSMQSGKDDHEGGLQSFIEDQQKLEGDVRLTFIQFDTQNPHEIIYDGVPIGEINEVTLTPRGGTPLLDATGMAIAKMAERIRGLEEKPDQVLFMIITDGMENASQEYTRDKVQAMTKEYEDKGWNFLYLGTNVDEFEEARGLGMDADNALGFAENTAGMLNAYRAISSNTAKARGVVKKARASGQSVCSGEVKATYAYTDEQRIAAKAEEPTPTGQKDIKST